MIVFNKELLFVHNPKTAGTSILKYLLSVLPEARTAGVKELGSYHPSLSASLGYACASLTQPPSAFKRVLVVARNPFDREISIYEHYRQNLQYERVDDDLNSQVLLEAVQQAGRMSFKDYLAWIWQTHGTCDLWHTENYYKSAETFALPQLSIVRMENLTVELSAALQGIILLKEDALPHINTTSRAAASSYYDASTIDIVRASYAWMFSQGLYDENHVPTFRS